MSLDGSAQAEEALAVASVLWHRHECDLILCTVSEAPAKGASPFPARASAEQATGYLAGIVRAAQDRGIRVTGVARTGAVSESLLTVAADEGASLLVWSAQVWRTPESGRLDPIAERLLRASPVPILSVPASPAPSAGNPLDGPERPFGTMLVALGEDVESAGLLAGSLRFAETFGVELVVLLELVPPGRSGREEAELRVEAEERLRGLARPFEESQISTALRITSGDPVESILSAAGDQDTDLIAVAGSLPGTSSAGRGEVGALIGRSSVPVLSFPLRPQPARP